MYDKIFLLCCNANVYICVIYISNYVNCLLYNNSINNKLNYTL